jgi:hypothetical protein
VTIDVLLMATSAVMPQAAPVAVGGAVPSTVHSAITSAYRLRTSSSTTSSSLTVTGQFSGHDELFERLGAWSVAVLVAGSS